MVSGGRQFTSRDAGTIALSMDRHVRKKRSKLESVGKDPDERFFMLATFCFDLSRKLKYISLALKDFFPEADPALAKMVLQDNQYIDPGDISWEESARRAEEIMLRLYDMLEEAGYQTELERVAGRAKP
jgi:hypothetical protein